MKTNVIYNEDCLVGMDRIPDNSVDFILSDLPYGLTDSLWDSLLPLDVLWLYYKRIIKPNGVIALTAAQPFTTTLINSNRENYKYCWYWIKNQATNFYLAKKMPLRKVEEVVIFEGNIYYPQKTTGHPPTNSAIGSSFGTVYAGENKRNYKGGDTTRYPTNILEFKCVDNYSRIHPNQKPVELFEYLIKTYTKDGELVLDNCIGSGTTAVACINTGRNYIGFEKDTKIYNDAIARINDL